MTYEGRARDQFLFPECPYLADPARVADAVDDDRPVIRGQELDGLESGHGRLGEIGLGVVQQFVDVARDPEAGGVVRDDGVAEAQDQGLRR